MEGVFRFIPLIGSLFIVTAVIFILFCIIDFYQLPVKRNYKMMTDKLPSQAFLKLILIADLHSHANKRKMDKILSLMSEEAPDLIALSGDIADDIIPIAGAKRFLKEIEGLAPTYYVTGNHEFRSKEIDEIKKLFRKHKINVLEHQYEKVMIKGIPIIVAGVDDPEIKKHKNSKFDWEKEMYKSFSKLNECKEFKILLSHRPERIKAYKNTFFDLILSGHAHGGQVVIPYLINGLFAPQQGLFPKYAGGMYKYHNIVHIVSRGVSYHSLRPRVFNPPEVVIIEIQGSAS